MSHYVQQMRRGIVELCVLAVLREGETYGYDIVRRLDGIDALAMGENTIYPALARLRKSGMVRVSQRPSDKGPPRRYFALSPEGYAYYLAVRAYWVEFRKGVDVLLERAEAGR